jgi:hypothetical protein
MFPIVRKHNLRAHLVYGLIIEPHYPNPLALRGWHFEIKVEELIISCGILTFTSELQVGVVLEFEPVRLVAQLLAHVLELVCT